MSDHEPTPTPEQLVTRAAAAVRALVADPAGTAAADQARVRWDGRAKPPGSLGQVEAVGVTLARIAGTCPPPVPARPVVLVFAADHGCVADGASVWPSEVTAVMVRNMATGGAAVNAFAETVGATVEVHDVGVTSEVALSGDEPVTVCGGPFGSGTASIASGPAMSEADAWQAVAYGYEAALTALEQDGHDLLVGGDMGIGNTTASAALIAWALGADGAVLDGAGVDALVGPGAGVGVVDDEGLATKRTIVAAAVDRARGRDAVGALAAAGGYEIAALAGAYLGAASTCRPVVVDGVIGVAAACVAEALAPGLRQLLLAGHRSTEPAATAGLAHLGLEPLLDLGLRLGEGTGAVLAVPVVQAAARALRTMADLPG